MSQAGDIFATATAVANFETTARGAGWTEAQITEVYEEAWQLCKATPHSMLTIIQLAKNNAAQGRSSAEVLDILRAGK